MAVTCVNMKNNVIITMKNFSSVMFKMNGKLYYLGYDNKFQVFVLADYPDYENGLPFDYSFPAGIKFADIIDKVKERFPHAELTIGEHTIDNA